MKFCLKTHLSKNGIVLATQWKDWHSTLKTAWDSGATRKEKRRRNIS